MPDGVTDGIWMEPIPLGGRTYVSSYVEGTLYIDLIDAKKKELIWEGEGIGYLTKDRDEKKLKSMSL
jgi:hypothetical protein